MSKRFIQSTNGDDGHIEISTENFPHTRIQISDLVCSPNMKFIATRNEKGESIFGWPIIEGKFELNFECLFRPNIKNKEGDSAWKLSRVSDCRHVLLKFNIDDKKPLFDFEIADITTSQRQILNAQGLKGKICEAIFLENGNLTVVKGEPVFRAFIFSKSNSSGEYQWICKTIIKLPKFYKCFIFPNGKLLILLEIPFIIKQWNLINRKFEADYVLNWNLFECKDKLNVDLNSDGTLLAIFAELEHEKARKIEIYIYSTKSSMILTTNSFYYEGYCLEEVCFVGSRENERLLVKCDDCYIIDPQNLSDKHIFHSELFDIDNIYNYNYVIELRGQHLWINNLAQNKEWCDFLNKKPKKYNKINAHSCGKDILKIIQCTLERYKRNSNEVNYDKPYRGKLYIWDINESEDYLTITAYKDEKQMENLIISKLDDYGEPFVEFKLLESDDLIMISSFGIYIWTIKSSCLITLLYFWFNVDIYQNCAQKTAKQALIDQLMFLTKSFGSKNIPPSPYFDQLIRHSKRLIYKRKVEKTKVKFSEGEKTKVKFSGLLEDYMNDATILKLYGKELIQVLLDKNQSEQIKVVFNNFLNQCLLQPLYDNDIYTFIKSADIITYMLLKLELFDKNFRFIDRFLSKTALLIPDAYKSSIDNYSALSHLEHCGIYVHLPYLQKISPFDYIFFWISDIWKFLKEKSQIYKFSKFPYIVYSSYFTSPKKTIKLIVPLLNFATYPEKEYFDYNELIYLSDNIFTSLNTPEYYKWWNIKALVKFKWATYGKYYYFAIWTIYSIFMTCFVVVATIPPSKISWSSQAILLVITVILGVFHFTFEVRQFVHGPKSYIASPWNWFDLSAVLFPTITSLIWLLDKPPSMWVLTVSSLLLELKFLMFLRALEYFGTYFAIMIGVAQQVFSFLIVLGVIILAFSHSLHLLLRPTTEYSYDKPSYTDDPNNPWNLVARYQSILPGGVIGESSLITTPDENTNLFAVLDTAIIAVYFILTGDSSAVSPWVLRKNWTLVILLIMFSFFTTIYLMNLFIGLLGMAIDATNNEESFLKLRGEILSEIELFWMLPYQRRKKNWFPQILFYEASIDELKKYVKSVKDEDYDDVSQPYLSSAILNITECGSNLEEKINERFDVMSKEFKNLVEQIAELTRSINNEKNKNEEK